MEIRAGHSRKIITSVLPDEGERNWVLTVIQCFIDIAKSIQLCTIGVVTHFTDGEYENAEC